MTEQNPHARPYLQPVSDLNSLQAGALIRRIGQGKDQQGSVLEVREGGVVVAEVVDLQSPAFVAEAGRLTPGPGDELFVHTETFKTSGQAEAARRVIEDWVLFKDPSSPHEKIMEFVEKAYSPAQILDFAHHDLLKLVFVPVQQRFKIGRFADKPNPRKERIERFRGMIEALNGGKHLTYLAFIPGEQISEPMFYSIGTKPHRETLKVLERETFGFRPNIGGHIKIISGEGEPKAYIVDAGSNEFSVGVRTPLSEAEKVADAMKKVYPEYEFKPVPGRDAYGVQQSY